MMPAPAVLIVIGVAGLAYANGANDASKGIATLVGSGVTGYRRALAWATLWTVAGASAAAVMSGALIKTFSTGIINAGVQLTGSFPIAVLAGATAWVLLASRTGMPVSTTHAITGALCGAGVVAFGWQGVRWMSLGNKVVLPLLLSPFIALAAQWLLFPLLRPLLATIGSRCACVEMRLRVVAETNSGAMLMQEDPVPMALHVGHLENCRGRSTTVAGIALDDALHWLSSGLTSFARGLNDAPKIIAPGLFITSLVQIDATFLFWIVGPAMGVGSYLAGRKVTETLAEKVTPMSTVEGLAANSITSFLVAFASRWGLPVSTTHVSAGAITAIGLRRTPRAVRWDTVTAMLEAWVITIPASAVMAVATWWCLERL